MSKYAGHLIHLIILLLLITAFHKSTLIEAGRQVLKVQDNQGVTKFSHPQRTWPETAVPNFNFGNSAAAVYEDQHVGPENSGNSSRGGGH